MLRPLWRTLAGTTVRPGGRPNLTVLLPNLVVGEYPTPDDAEWLRQQHGITSVLSLQDDADLASKALTLAEMQSAYVASAIRFHRIPVTDCDTEMLLTRLDEIIALLHELLSAGTPVYLHCNAGFNRAPTVAIAYLHARHGMPLSEARDYVKQRRPCIPYMQVLEAKYGLL